MSGIRVTEQEAAELLRMAGNRGIVLGFSFGPGWMKLEDDGDDYDWSLARLAEIRGYTLRASKITGVVKGVPTR